MGSVDISQASQVIQWLVQKTHLEALFKNRESTERWEKYKKDHEDLLPRLQDIRKELHVKVMVPIGNKAMMPGQLVHTNEVMISLGDGWFVKHSVEHAMEVCNRRIKKCNEFLESLGKERKLLESRKDFSKGHNVFPEEELKEIIEPLDEKEEKEWEERHREAMKSYAKTKAKERQEENQGDEDTWRRLEELALQEEMKGELEWLGVDGDESDEDESDEDSENNFDEDGESKSSLESDSKSELDSDDLSDDPDVTESKVHKSKKTDDPTKSNVGQSKKSDHTEVIKEFVAVRDVNTSEIPPTLTPAVQEPQKKISKFKAARMANR